MPEQLNYSSASAAKEREEDRLRSEKGIRESVERTAFMHEKEWKLEAVSNEDDQAGGAIPKEEQEETRKYAAAAIGYHESNYWDHYEFYDWKEGQKDYEALEKRTHIDIKREEYQTAKEMGEGLAAELNNPAEARSKEGRQQQRYRIFEVIEKTTHFVQAANFEYGKNHNNSQEEQFNPVWKGMEPEQFLSRCGDALAIDKMQFNQNRMEATLQGMQESWTSNWNGSGPTGKNYLEAVNIVLDAIEASVPVGDLEEQEGKALLLLTGITKKANQALLELPEGTAPSTEQLRRAIASRNYLADQLRPWPKRTRVYGED